MWSLKWIIIYIGKRVSMHQRNSDAYYNMISKLSQTQDDVVNWRITGCSAFSFLQRIQIRLVRVRIYIYQRSLEPLLRQEGKRQENEATILGKFQKWTKHTDTVGRFSIWFRISCGMKSHIRPCTYTTNPDVYGNPKWGQLRRWGQTFGHRPIRQEGSTPNIK